MEQTVAWNLTKSVEWVVNKAMADADSTLRLGENVGLAVVSEKDLTNHTLYPEEERILSPRACRRNRTEFALGRAAAHSALNQIGLENSGPVLRGPGGEPVWCDGIAGSITHCYPWSVAVVTKCSNPVAIGVDLETMEGIQGTDISRLVCREAELAWVGQGNLRERLTMVFSAKEAIYKAFYPLCRRYIDFLEVVLTSCPEQYRLESEFLAPLGPGLPQGQACAVYCVRHAELIFSCVIHKVPRNVLAPSPWKFDAFCPAEIASSACPEPHKGG